MNHHPSLTSLKDDMSLRIAVALIVSPRPIYEGMKSNVAVQSLIKAWQTNDVNADIVEGFVRELLADFRPGYHFSWEHTLCGLAVAMERCEGEFPERLLKQLARLKITETPMVAAVAAYALEARRSRVSAQLDEPAPVLSLISSEDYDAAPRRAELLSYHLDEAA